MYYCFKRLTDENIFLLTFALTSIYFSGEDVDGLAFVMSSMNRA
jgi:hypothetical protein